eukprot:jgi/Tetstr1/439116/TSEL_002981.t1
MPSHVASPALVASNGAVRAPTTRSGKRVAACGPRGLRGSFVGVTPRPGGWGWPAARRAAASDASMGGSADFSPKEGEKAAEASSGDFSVFPRIKESDPYRKLAVSRDADFEEIQDARNFLVDQYRWHEQSRESIELAFEKILNEKMRVRHRLGFRPPKRGRKTDAEGDAPPETLVDRVKDMLEPSVPVVTLVNEGAIYLALAVWAAIQSGAADPILPMGLALGYSTYKVFQKRNSRNPDGPYLGNSPIFGALLQSITGAFLGAVAGWVVSTYVPFPAMINPAAVAVALIPAMCGVLAICFK